MRDRLDDIKIRFARQLELSLRKAYGGKLPSLSSLARDFSLRSPHLPHVSTETVRKWLRGSAIPQSPRMQALATWLGEDLLLILNQHSESSFVSVASHQPPHDLPAPTTSGNLTIQQLFDSLSPADLDLVIRLAQSLANKSNMLVSEPVQTALSSDTVNQPVPDMPNRATPKRRSSSSKPLK